MGCGCTGGKSPKIGLSGSRREFVLWLAILSGELARITSGDIARMM